MRHTQGCDAACGKVRRYTPQSAEPKWRRRGGQDSVCGRKAHSVSSKGSASASVERGSGVKARHEGESAHWGRGPKSHLSIRFAGGRGGKAPPRSAPPAVHGPAASRPPTRPSTGRAGRFGEGTRGARGGARPACGCSRPVGRSQTMPRRDTGRTSRRCEVVRAPTTPPWRRSPRAQLTRGYWRLSLLRISGDHDQVVVVPKEAI
jgi:hypothetical protein